MSRFVMTDGEKAVTLTGNEGWTFFSGFPKTTQEEQYGRVAAAFRAYNLIANTVASMPFVLYKGNEEFDSSAKWENKIGYLPNPQELFRLDVLSLISSNSAYNIRTTDALGYKTRGLYHAVSDSFSPQTDPVTGGLLEIQRTIGTQIEHYKPDDKRLVRIWKLDHTTELLPSRNTEARAIMSAAGQVYYADMWIEHFYRRGGIAPTLIAMKGLVDSTSKEEKERSWSQWLLGLGNFGKNIARIFNAEAMEVKQMGSSVTDLKNNDVYRQALENISLGLGIPISRLLSNSANYATAGTDDATWFRDDIIPRCNFLSYEYNRQVFQPDGLRLEFKPETLDPEQEDETERANAISTFADFFAKCESYELFMGMCETFGYEISDSLDAAAKKYYTDKAARAKEVQVQTQLKPDTALAQQDTQTQEQQPPEPAPAKWQPTIKELDEMRVWRKACLQKLKKNEPLTFEYIPHYGGLPENVTKGITARLTEAKSAEDIESIFDASQYTVEEKSLDPLFVLAQALNNVAEAERAKK